MKKILFGLMFCGVLAWADTISDYHKAGMDAYKAGNYSVALENFQKILEIELKTLPANSEEIADSYSNIGAMYNFMGNYPNALEFYQKSLTIRELVLGKNHLDNAISSNGIGNVYFYMGDYSKALEFYQKSLIICESMSDKKHRDITAINYNGIGNVYRAKKDYPKALNFYQKSLSIYETFLDKNHPNIATNYNNIGNIYYSMSDYPKALEFYQKSLAIGETVLGKNHPDIARSNNNIGALYGSMGVHAKALEFYQKSLTIYETFLDKNHPNIATSHHNIGTVYNSMGDYAKAYTYAKKSYDIFIINRDYNFSILDSAQKQKYLGTDNEQIPFLLSAACAYTKTNPSESKKLSEATLNDWLNYKGNIYDSENALAMLYETTTDKNVKATIESLNAQKRALAKMYQTLPKPDEVVSYQQGIKTLENTISKLEQELSSKASSFQEEMGLKHIAYSDIVKHLKEGELYIDYAKAGEFYYLFSLDKSAKVSFVQISKEESQAIDEAVGQFRKDVEVLTKENALSAEKLNALQVSSKKSLEALYRLALSKPLGKTLGNAKSLIISTDGALRLLPFEALFNAQTGKYLLEEKEMRYIPSGKELVRIYRHGQKASSQEIALFSNPDFNAKGITSVSKEELSTPNTSRSGIIKSLFQMRFSPLPGTQNEADEIKGLLSNKRISEYKDANAKEANLLEIKQPKILHIATHGFFINDDSIPNPMLKSGIALSGANASAVMGKSDGIVTSLKLSGLALKGTDLVVLSACQTGEVDPKSTETVSGLNKAFIQAGANNMVMSLWPVADKETASLMSGFYTNIQHNKPYAKALKESKLAMMQQGLHPYYWAAFIISGKGE